MAKSSIECIYGEGNRIKVVTECDESFPDCVAEVRSATSKTFKEQMAYMAALDRVEVEPEA